MRLLNEKERPESDDPMKSLEVVNAATTDVQNDQAVRRKRSAA
jgi:hypothetical protein